MAAGNYLAALRVAIIGDNSSLDKSIKDSKKKTEDYGKSSEKLGKSLGKLFTGIGFAVVTKKLFDLGKQAENLFRVQELAETKLDQTLIATGHAAGLTAEELKKLASGLQDVTTYGDEAIIGAESLLLTFKDIGGDVFPRALESILDVSQAMGQDLKSSTVQIGKALNEPVAGLAALSRVGIQFSEDQKELIKGFVETGDKASAQTVILKELESQFGGVARAVADTDAGISQQLNNSYGDLLETIGGVISHGLTPFRKDLLREITTVNESIKAHFLRNKVLVGEATIIEKITLKEVEYKRSQEDLKQAKDNLAASTAKMDELLASEDVRLRNTGIAIQASIEGQKELIKERENHARTIGTQLSYLEMERQAEQDSLDVTLAKYQAVGDLTDETNENTESVEANVLAWGGSRDIIRDTSVELSEAVLQMIANKEAADEYEQALAKTAITGQFLAETVIGGMGTAFTSLGQAIVENGLQFKDFGRVALESLAGVLSAMGAQLAANAALQFFPIPPLLPNFVGGAGALAGSAAAFTASGIARGLAGSFEQGGIIPGRPSKTDNMVASVASGELVANQDQKDRMLMEFLNGGGRSRETRVIVNLDKRPILDAVAKGTRNGTLIVDSRSVK